MVRLRYPQLWNAAGYSLAAFIVLLSVMPDAPVPAGPDRPGHALAYFVLASWFFAMFPKRVWLVVAGCLVLGGGIEVVQATLPYRTMDFYDFIADAVGVAAAWLLIGVRLRRVWYWVEGRIAGAL